MNTGTTTTTTTAAAVRSSSGSGAGSSAMSNKSSTWRDLLNQVFTSLEKDSKVSKLELERMLEAMNTSIPIGLSSTATENLDIVGVGTLLSFLDESNLEDLLWFIEKVLSVESDMKTQWNKVVSRWRDVATFLNDEGAATYLVKAQPDRIAKWLGPRLKSPETKSFTHDSISDTKLHLGFSPREVELLFEATTHTEVQDSLKLIEPYYRTLVLLKELSKLVGEGSGAVSDDQQQELKLLVTDLLDYPNEVETVVDGVRGWGCILSGHGGLPLLTNLICNPNVAADIRDPIRVIMFKLLDFHFERSEDPAEAYVCSVVAAYLSHLSTPSLVDFIQGLLSMGDDYARAQSVDALESWDAYRFDANIVPKSLLLREEIIGIIANRLNLYTHHTLHERRTPIRAHLLKLLANIMIGGGAEARTYFVKVKVLTAFASILRFSALYQEPQQQQQQPSPSRSPSRSSPSSSSQPLQPLQEQQSVSDMATGDGDHTGAGTTLHPSTASGSTSSTHSTDFSLLQHILPTFPYIPVFRTHFLQRRPYLESGDELDEEDHYTTEESLYAIYKYYAEDFADNAFYGPKDYEKVFETLTILMEEMMWGVGFVDDIVDCDGMVELLLTSPHTSHPLLLALLNSTRLSHCLERMAVTYGEMCCDKLLGFMDAQQYTGIQHTVFSPMLCPSDRYSNVRRSLHAIVSKNAVLQLFAVAKIVLEYRIQQLDSINEITTFDYHKVDVSAATASASTADEMEHSKSELTECLQRLAAVLPMTQTDIADLVVSLYTRIHDYSAKLGSQWLQQRTNLPASTTASSSPAPPPPQSFLLSLHVLQLCTSKFRLAEFVHHVKYLGELVCGLSSSSSSSGSGSTDLDMQLFGESATASVVSMAQDRSELGPVTFHRKKFLPLRSLLTRYPHGTLAECVHSILRICNLLADLQTLHQQPHGSSSSSNSSSSNSNPHRLILYLFYELCYCTHESITVVPTVDAIMELMGLHINKLSTMNQVVTHEPETVQLTSLLGNGIQLAKLHLTAVPTPSAPNRSNSALQAKSRRLSTVTFINIASSWYLWANASPEQQLCLSDGAAKHFSLQSSASI